MGQKADTEVIYGPPHNLTLCPLPGESRVTFTLRIEEWIKGDTTSIWDNEYLRALQQLPAATPAISPGDKLWTGTESSEYLPSSKSEIWDRFGRTRADLHYRGKLRKPQPRKSSTADTKQKAPQPSPKSLEADFSPVPAPDTSDPEKFYKMDVEAPIGDERPV